MVGQRPRCFEGYVTIADVLLCSSCCQLAGSSKGPAAAATYSTPARPTHCYPSSRSQIIAVSLFQCVMAWAVRNCSWGTIFALGWGVSGFCNQNLFCAQHELSHFLAFKKPSHNKLLSILSNCPLVVPTATTFRKYHQEHHSHLVSQSLVSTPLRGSPQQRPLLLSTSATSQPHAAGNLWLNKINLGKALASAALQLPPGALEPVSV